MLFQILVVIGIAQASQRDCATIVSYKDFYFCSLEKHPKYEISRLKVTEGEAAVEKASQWQNPEVSLKSTGGDKAGEKVGATELETTISVSQLWLRSSKKDIAEAEKKIANIESQESLLNAQKELIKDLYRLRQLNTELELVNETLTTFETIRKQYRGKLARGPEQEITLNLVELATSDYELKKNHLATEKSEISAKIKALWGQNFEIKKEFLPPIKEKWPEPSSISAMKNSFEVQKLSLENEKARAEKDLVQRESWPSLDMGGIINRTTEGPTQYMNYGVSAKMSFPLVSLNGGARKLANTRALQARLMSDWALRKAENDKEILIQKYKSSVDSLKKSSNQEEIKRKHQKIDALFRQGLASGGLVIEAHRQITEYTESQNEHENSAIEAFLEIKTLSGENFEEILQ